GQGNGYRSHFYRLVRLHDVGASDLRDTLDGSRGNHNAVLSNLQQKMRVDELVRPESSILIVEHRLQPAGAGGLIDLVINREQAAGGQLALIIAAISVHLQPAASHSMCDGG